MSEDFDVRQPLSTLPYGKRQQNNALSWDTQKAPAPDLKLQIPADCSRGAAIIFTREPDEATSKRLGQSLPTNTVLQKL
jgi:hypothetical protein